MAQRRPERALCASAVAEADDAVKVADAVYASACLPTIFEPAEISGDHNPIHLDDAYAATTPFGDAKRSERSKCPS